MGSGLPPQLASIEKEVGDIFRTLATGFQNLDKTEDEGRQTKLLEGQTAKMREAKRLIKEFDREMKEEEGKINPESNRLLNEKKQSLIKELNSFVALRKTYTSSIGNKHEFLDGGSCAGSGRDMSNQEHIPAGGPQMDETDETEKTIERTNKVMRSTTNTGAETATTVKVQTEQVSKVNNKVDTAQPSIRKMARKRCIMLILLLITVGIIVIVMLKVVYPDDKVPGSTPPPRNRRLLMTALDLQ